jgi:hypothetical protein
MGGSLSTYEWVLPWLVRWTRRAGTIDFCPALAALVRSAKYYFPHSAHFFTLLVLIAQQPGQAVVLGCLSLFLYITQREGLQEGWNSFCLIEKIQEELCLTSTLMERALDQKTRKKTKMSKACRNMCPDFGHHVRITWKNKLR